VSALPDQALLQLLESISDTVLITGLDGIILFWNRGAEEAFGYTKEEMVGTPVGRLYGEDQKVALNQLRQQVLAGGRVANIEVVERGKTEGVLKTILLSLVPIRDPGGEIRWLAGIGKDITELKRLQQEVVEAKKLETVHHMMVAMNHEMNQPLAVISLMVQAANKKGTMGSGELALVQKQAKRLSDLLLKIREIKQVKVTEYVRGEMMLDLDPSKE